MRDFEKPRIAFSIVERDVFQEADVALDFRAHVSVCSEVERPEAVVNESGHDTNEGTINSPQGWVPLPADLDLRLTVEHCQLSLTFWGLHLDLEVVYLQC